MDILPAKSNELPKNLYRLPKTYLICLFLQLNNGYQRYLFQFNLSQNILQKHFKKQTKTFTCFFYQVILWNIFC